MQRCEQSAGRYHVALRVANNKEPFHLQITGHQNIVSSTPDPRGGGFPDIRVMVEEAPWVGTEKPFEGELCIHETGWLEQGVPGRDYPLYYEFTVEKL